MKISGKKVSLVCLSSSRSFAAVLDAGDALSMLQWCAVREPSPSRGCGLLGRQRRMLLLEEEIYGKGVLPS